MATNLPTNFVNDVLSADMGGKRRYTKTDNSDGTISLTDATVYDVEGSTYGATQINATNEAINELSATLDTTTSTANSTQSTLNTKLPSTISGFSVGTDGKAYITYKVGADTVTKKLGELDGTYVDKGSSSNYVYTANEDGLYLAHGFESHSTYRACFSLGTNGIQILKLEPSAVGGDDLIATTCYVALLKKGQYIINNYTSHGSGPYYGPANFRVYMIK